tara:strand:+ start:2587 stop:3171 length:585 start_codon:yes stop_codon:yes gene_type:complete
MFNGKFDKNLTRHVPSDFSFGAIFGKFLLSVISIISIYSFVVYMIDQKSQNQIPEIIEMIPPPGNLPREHIAYVEFNIPLDEFSVFETLVYRIHKSDGTISVKKKVANAGRLIVKDNGKTLIFMINLQNLPAVGERIVVDVSGIRSRAGNSLVRKYLEYDITDESPDFIFEQLLTKLSLSDLKALWDEWLSKGL